ncbi:MAG TPA: polyribonucleotide nucleotidyltransferase [Candidatus Nanoarchaeia archaeon]|nr:polyribonucleotide nucleotidyltransferase [Candidatus Nanoarchaeia archaeon]
MSNFQEQKVTGQWLGRELSLRSGKVAQQADAAVIAQYGETVVMATVVEAKEERNVDYFPLMVDFEERLYAAGIIKGSRWIKREGRPSDESILNGRMVDRSLRPLFSGESRKDTQVVCTVLSYDNENNYDIVALVAASAALTISGIEWKGPIGGVKVGLIENNLVFNPTFEQMTKSQMELTVVGTKDRTVMIEAGANEVKEEIILEAITRAQTEMQPAIQLINDFKKKVGGKEKTQKIRLLSEDQIKADEEKKKLIATAETWLAKNVYAILFDKEYYTKGERKLAVAKIKEGLDKFLFEQNVSEDLRKFVIGKTVEDAVDSEITKQLLDNEKRVDGRALDEIRQLYSEVALLPRNHGSGLFSRGETQIMSIVTLGAPGLEQNLEGLEGKSTKRFMHHYNFPSYSVGETGPNRGPGRREIGHGALAEKALLPVIPEKVDFPYTIRVVSETLGSNGSSSMGSTCCSSLSLMDAGVPIKRPVAGVAIGLASNADMSRWKVLTDIQDLEDGQGGMDFKITGTTEGITAIQLDTKTDGLNLDIVKEALERGRKGRLQILEVMAQAIPAPRAELSKYAPRVVSFTINPEKIRDVIGPGGKVINKIIDEHEVEIDIEDDGSVFVTGTVAENVAKAVEWIKNIAHEFKVGEIFTGPVAKILDFGAFVELTPGNDGMVHVSKLAPYRVGSPSDLVSVGQMVTVKIDEIDDQGRINLSMKDCKENEPLWKDRKGEQKGEFGGGFRPRAAGAYGGGAPRREFGGGNRGPRRDRR